MLVVLLAALESDQDRERFIWLYENHHRMMEQVALQILHSQYDAQDAVQNAFLQVIRHFQKISDIPCEELPFWLISIVKNEALMIRRKRKKEILFEDWEGVVEESKNVLSYTALVELFLKLPETYRSVLEMKMILGYTDREVADHLHISETAVSTRANRGRKLLREIVEKEGICP